MSEHLWQRKKFPATINPHIRIRYKSQFVQKKHSFRSFLNHKSRTTIIYINLQLDWRKRSCISLMPDHSAVSCKYTQQVQFRINGNLDLHQWRKINIKYNSMQDSVGDNKNPPFTVSQIATNFFICCVICVVRGVEILYTFRNRKQDTAASVIESRNSGRQNKRNFQIFNYIQHFSNCNNNKKKSFCRRRSRLFCSGSHIKRRHEAQRQYTNILEFLPTQIINKLKRYEVFSTVKMCVSLFSI